MGEPAQQAGRQGQDEVRQEIGSDERQRQAQENQEKEPCLLLAAGGENKIPKHRRRRLDHPGTHSVPKEEVGIICF